MKRPIMTTPCKNCPFRKDTLPGWLGRERMEEILNTDSFVCHKTTKGDNKALKQCAGFMLIKEGGSEAVRLSKVLKIDLGLKGRELIFDTQKQCIEHHGKD